MTTTTQQEEDHMETRDTAAFIRRRHSLLTIKPRQPHRRRRPGQVTTGIYALLVRLARTSQCAWHVGVSLGLPGPGPRSLFLSWCLGDDCGLDLQACPTVRRCLHRRFLGFLVDRDTAVGCLLLTF